MLQTVMPMVSLFFSISYSLVSTGSLFGHIDTAFTKLCVSMSSSCNRCADFPEYHVFLFSFLFLFLHSVCAHNTTLDPASELFDLALRLGDFHTAAASKRGRIRRTN